MTILEKEESRKKKWNLLTRYEEDLRKKESTLNYT